MRALTNLEIELVSGGGQDGNPLYDLIPDYANVAYDIGQNFANFANLNSFSNLGIDNSFPTFYSPQSDGGVTTEYFALNGDYVISGQHASEPSTDTIGYIIDHALFAVGISNSIRNSSIVAGISALPEGFYFSADNNSELQAIQVEPDGTNIHARINIGDTVDLGTNLLTAFLGSFIHAAHPHRPGPDENIQ